MNLDLGPTFTRVQAVVNGLAAAIVTGAVARLTETRLHATEMPGGSQRRPVHGYGRGEYVMDFAPSAEGE
jgi:hypothetical protein